METRPTRRPTSRQEEILEHTLALVHEEGLAGVTIRRLAERVGFTEPAIYRHFRSKQELLLALMDRFATQLLTPIRSVASDPTLPGIERLVGVVRHHVSMILRTEGLPMLVLGEALAGGNEALADRVRRLLRTYLDILEQLIEQIPERGARPPAKELALLLIGLPAAVAIRSRLLPDAELEARAEDELVRFHVTRLTGVGLDPG